MALCPVTHIIALGVVRVECSDVVLAFVTEHAAKRLQPPAVTHELVPVKVAGLVAQMADEGAVGLAQRDAAARTFVIIRLGHVERDGSAVMARQYGRPTRKICQKLKNRPWPPRCGLQPQSGQGVKQPTLGSFNLHPAPSVGGLGQVRQHPGLAAGDAILGVIVGRHCEIAGLVFCVVVAQPVQTSAVLGGAPSAHAPPKTRAILRRGRQGGHRERIGQKCQRAATVHTLHAVEKNQVTAMVAIEYAHGVELIPSKGTRRSSGKGERMPTVSRKACRPEDDCFALLNAKEQAQGRAPSLLWC
ncbi:hypothetical protein D3C72_1365380 [compost metagenome]